MSVYSLFVFRTGLFHDRNKTIAFYGAWTVWVVASHIIAGTIWIFAFDPLTYLSPLVMWVIYKITRLASDCLGRYCDVFNPIPTVYRPSEFISLGENTTTVSLFRDPKTFDSYRDAVRKALFHRYELPIAGVLYAVWFYFYVPAAPQAGIYGFTPEPLLTICIGLTTIFMFIYILGIASSGWTLLALIRSVHHLRDLSYDFKTKNYTDFIMSEDASSKEEGMDYHRFYLMVTPLGHVLSGLAMFVLVTIALCAAYWILAFAFWELSPVALVYVASCLALGLAIVFFAWPQLDMHGLLKDEKTEILSSMAYTRTEINEAFISQLKMVKESNSVPAEVDSLQKALEGWDLNTKYVEQIPTWSFPPTTTMQVALAVLIPVLLSILTFFLDYSRVTP